jgi:hypothetical protein
MTNGIADIINRLEKQKVAIDRAIAALKDVGDEAITEPAANGTTAKPRAKKATKKTRSLSPEARERISAAQRARWAATRKAEKKAAKGAR